MINVPGGVFLQSDGSSSFEHTVTAFRLARYETTYYLWYTVRTWAGSNGYNFANPGREGHNGGTTAPTADKYEPVTTINWRDAVVWCNAYSQMSGLTPVYYSDAGFTLPLKDSRDGSYGSTTNSAVGSFDTPYVNWAADGYRLPTEGEWQYAAAWQGTNPAYGAVEYPVSSGNYWTPYNYACGATSSGQVNPVAWFTSNSGNMTHPEGRKLPNMLPLNDMSGNVWEWCWDWYAAYPGASGDYKGPAIGGNRARRGGCYYDTFTTTLIGYRATYGPPYWESDNTGFRVAAN